MINQSLKSSQPSILPSKQMVQPRRVNPTLDTTPDAWRATTTHIHTDHSHLTNLANQPAMAAAVISVSAGGVMKDNASRRAIFPRSEIGPRRSAVHPNPDPKQKHCLTFLTGSGSSGRSKKEKKKRKKGPRFLRSKRLRE